MKKVLSIVLVLVLGITMLVGCQRSNRLDTQGESNNDGNQEVTVSLNEGEEPSKPVSEDSTKVKEDAQNVVSEKIPINIAVLKGPTAMGIVKVMEDAKNDVAANQYEFTIAGTADEITAGIIKGDYDIAAIPCNLASVLYNRTDGAIVTAGINTLGVLYVLETGDEINKVEDLKGKTIYSTGLGTTPEYTLNYLLSSYGLEPQKDVYIEYKTEATEVAAILSENSDAIAMLPQPFVTTAMMNNDKIRIALDVTKEWDTISDNNSTVVTGVVVINKEFLENNKEAVDAFLDEYEASAQYVNENVEEAAVLIEEFDIFKAVIAQKAIPYCNITMIRGDQMQEKINGYLSTLFEQNPETVGGAMPDEGFYYK